MPVKAPVQELPGGSQVSPASTVPLPHWLAIVVLVVLTVDVVLAGTLVVVTLVLVVVVGFGTVVVVAEHCPSPHASQQLDTCPTQAVPPFGALQSLASCLMLHFVFPFLSVRQQVTKPSLPHVDLSAHFLICSLHSLRSWPCFTRASATFVTQLTYFP